MVDDSYYDRIKPISAITQRDGWYWPTDDTKARPSILRAMEPSIKAFMAHVTGRDLIVQAGGNVGVYPLALSDHFRKVVTAEPDKVNFDCLCLNLQARDSLKRVTALNAGVGEANGVCDMVEVEEHNCGAHRVDFAVGVIPVWAIDNLPLDACDAIWLDIEGAELSALKGAAKTIARFSPTIGVEDKGLSEAYGVPLGGAGFWLAGLGYQEVAVIGRDKIYRKNP